MAKSRVRGQEKLTRKLLKLPDAMTAELVKILDWGGDMILESAQMLVPVQSGQLRAALSKRKKKNGLKVTVGVQGAPAKRRVPYFFWVEFGTQKTKAKPYLGPANKSARPHIRARVRTELKRVISQVAR